MIMIPLAQVVQLNPRPPKGLDDSQQISFLAMASLSEDGEITHQETRSFSDVKKGFTYFQRGDVLLAKITPCFENGKSAITDKLEHQIGFGSTEFHVLRAIPEKLDSKFLFHLVRSSQLRFLGKKSMKGAAGHKRVPTDFLEKFEIPAWSLNDQIRIAHLLDKVEGLIAQRKQHLQQLNDLLNSVFLEMFGDPERNEKRWDKFPIGKIVENSRNGLSPARGGEFEGLVYTLSALTGDVFREIFKKDTFAKLSQNYIPTPRDFLVCRGNGNINLVGRGGFYPGLRDDIMFPDTVIALTIEDGVINRAFLDVLWRTKFIRSQIEKSARTANGTFKVNQTSLGLIDIIFPPLEEQNAFEKIAVKLESLGTQYKKSLDDLEALYGVLSQQAFKGELDVSRVSLPSIKPEEVKAVATDPLHTYIEQSLAINLPDTGNVLDALTNMEARKKLITQWLEAYCGQLGSTPFSVQRLMAVVQTRLEELHPDNDFELGTNDYELIKTWVFEALADGRLQQSRDITGHDEDNGEPIFGNLIEIRYGAHL